MYERYDGENKILVCTNRTNQEQEILVPDEYKEKVYTLKKSSRRKLEPYGGIIMKK